jgi:hypothetical protein
VEFLGATTNELLFAAIIMALVLLGTKIGAIGEAVARFTHRRR